MTSELMIEMKNVHKWFGELHVLNDINLEINKGEKIVICGPSGSGKSTLIRCINRLEEHQRGNIIVEGTELMTVGASREFAVRLEWYFNNLICFHIFLF